MQSVEMWTRASIHEPSDRCTIVDPGTGAYVRETDSTGTDRGAKWRHLDAAEQMLYERCVYLLVNSAGTSHSGDDLDVL